MLRRSGTVAGNATGLRFSTSTRDPRRYPLLLANFQPAFGAVPSVLLGAIGVFGLTDAFRDEFDDMEWGWTPRDELQTAREISQELRSSGATLVVLLSHLGLDTPGRRGMTGGSLPSSRARWI